jgi:hypothetical protein
MVTCLKCGAPLAYEGAKCGACVARRIMAAKMQSTGSAVPSEAPCKGRSWTGIRVGAAVAGLLIIIGVGFGLWAIMRNRSRPTAPPDSRGAISPGGQGARAEVDWPPAPAPTAKAVPGKVLEVRRADVLVLDLNGGREVVRLHGVEAPGLGAEVVSVCECITRMLMPPGATVAVERTGQDSHGRTTAHLFPRLGGPSASAVELVAGYAWYDRADFPDDAFCETASSFASDHGWGLDDPQIGRAGWKPPAPETLAQECARAIRILTWISAGSGDRSADSAAGELLIEQVQKRSRSIVTLAEQATRDRDELRATEEAALRQAEAEQRRRKHEEEREAERAAQAARNIDKAAWLAEHTCRVCGGKGWRVCGWCNGTGTDPDTGRRCLVCGGKGFYDCPYCVNGITD